MRHRCVGGEQRTDWQRRWHGNRGNRACTGSIQLYRSGMCGINDHVCGVNCGPHFEKGNETDQTSISTGGFRGIRIVYFTYPPVKSVKV